MESAEVPRLDVAGLNVVSARKLHGQLPPDPPSQVIARTKVGRKAKRGITRPRGRPDESIRIESLRSVECLRRAVTLGDTEPDMPARGNGVAVPLDAFARPPDNELAL